MNRFVFISEHLKRFERNYIYRKYDIELTDMNAPLKYKADFLASSEELLVKVKPRKF